MDIANRTNTSPATVSNALNNRPNAVSARVRAKILATAREMGYRPNRRARQLRAGASLSLGFQIDSTMLNCNRRRLTATLVMTMFQGAAGYARSRGYHLHMLMPPTGDDLAEVRRQIIEENAVDGAVLVGLAEADDQSLRDLVDDLRKIEVPVVSTDLRLARLGVPQVALERQRAIEQAAERIVAHGHRAAGYIGVVRPTLHEQRPRVELFREALQARGATLAENQCVVAPDEIDAYRAVYQMLSRPAPQQRPTCLIFGGDHLAMAGLKAAADLGLAVPADVSVVSMNNAPYGRDAIVPLCTIDHRYMDLGVMLAKLLLDQLSDKTAPVPQSSVLSATLIEGASLGRVKSAN